jgi:hypothetical protein
MNVIEWIKRVLLLLLGMPSFLLAIIIMLTGAEASGQLLIRITDCTAGTSGYLDESGKIVIPLGKYADCYTDTFRNYAIVLDSAKGMVAIDRHERILNKVFIFDNGPDYASEGLFRITANGKIGYADLATGKIIIRPQFSALLLT